MKYLAWFFLSSAFLTPLALADTESELSRVDIFSLGYNGFIAKKMPQQILYEKVLNSNNAVRILGNIIANPSATPESKAYAICGLQAKGHELPGNAFKKGDAVTVNVLNADVIMKLNYNDFIKNIRQHGCNWQSVSAESKNPAQVSLSGVL